MWRALLASSLLLACTFLGADAFAQEFCTCSGKTFQWGGCDDQGVCDPGQWYDCTPSPDDSYTIRSSCHVTVDGDDVLLAQAPPERLAVKSGGSFTMRGPAELRLGTIGLLAEPGSSVDLGGCYRRYAGDGEECAPRLTNDALFSIGRVVPCRDGVCDGDAEIVRLAWSEMDPSLAEIDDLLERIDVARDALCFWQRDDGSGVGADSGYCYKITDAGKDDERHLDFDIRQVWSTQSEQAGYPLARREVLTATLADDAPVGTRTLHFVETSLMVGRAGPVGRHLRCNGDQRSHLIATSTDAPAGDSMMLADARGLESAHPAGTTCHVDWGWAESDLAFVMAPVHVTPHVAALDETTLLLEGSTALRAVVVDGLGGRTGGASSASIEIRGGPLVALEHVWVTDPLVTDTAAVLVDNLACGTAIQHLTVTGGPPDPAYDKNYALGWFGNGNTSPDCGYTLRHLYTRYMGDDNFVLESSGADPLGAIDMRFIQAGPSSQPGDSGQFIDFGRPNPTHVHLADALCTACTSDDGRGSLIAPSAGSGLIENLLWIGVRNGGLTPTSVESNNWNFHFERFGVIGSQVDAANSLGVGSLAGLVADRFYVRDVVDPRANSHRLCMTLPFAAQTKSLSHGVFADVRLGAMPCEVSDATLSNLYFIDVTRSGAAGPLLSVPNVAAPVVLSRLTMGTRSASSGISIGVRATGLLSAEHLTLDGLLLTGFDGPGAIRAISLGSTGVAQAVEWGAPSCFYDNVQTENPAVLAAFGVAPVVGVDPHFVDPAALRFDLAASSPLRAVGCGAGEGGYATVDWAHQKAKLVPTYVGPRRSDSRVAAEAMLAIGVVGALRRRMSA